jgi:SPP1 family predicted phage head-tail adaptor
VIRAGALDRRCRFERRDTTPDAYGNVTAGAWTTLLTVWGALSEKPGREAMKAGRMESAALAEIWIRDSAAARGITAADRVVIDGAAYAIRHVGLPQRSGMITIQIERGVAP